MNKMQKLRRLDEIVTNGRTASIGTQFGKVIVNATRFHGYVAEIVDFNNVKTIAFGILPSIAFLKLGGLVKEMHG